MKNEKGEPSVLVLRPADSAETVAAWRQAMENKEKPTILILSRQDVIDLPSVSGDRKADSKGLLKGGYVVLPEQDAEVILVANGSEVSLLCEVSEELKLQGIKSQVVSVPTGKKVFGLTAGVPSTLYPIMKGDFKVYGLERFGASAPYKVLDEKFGYTKSNILAEIKQFLGK